MSQAQGMLGVLLKWKMIGRGPSFYKNIRVRTNFFKALKIISKITKYIFLICWQYYWPGNQKDNVSERNGDSVVILDWSCNDIPVAHLHGSSYSIFRVYWARIWLMPEIARFWQSLIVPSTFIRDRVCFHLCSEEKFHYDETSTVQIVGWFG